MKRLLFAVPLLTVGAIAAQPSTPRWAGTITMYAQHYTPNKPGAKKPLVAFRQVADEFEKARPGVKISFWTEDVPDTNQAIRVRAAAGELWDVFWAQWSSLNATLPKGVALNLAPYFRQKNPYVPTAATWADAMNKTVIAETAAPDGASYNVNGDYVAFSFFYNADLFKKAGITAPPTSWAGLIDTARKLKAANIGVMAAVPAYPWWQRHFLSDFYSRDYTRIAGFDGQPGQSALDEAVAINKGILSPKDERFMAWWPIMKQFTDTWVPDYLPLDPDKNYDAFQDFVAGKVAMIYEGSYKPNEMRDAGVTFGIGAFNFPVLERTVSRFVTGTNTANAVGGVSAAFQYAVSTAQANRSMREAGKLEAVVDWVRFFSTPRNLERITNESGSFVPTWSGAQAKLSFDAKALNDQIKLPRRALEVGNTGPNLKWGDMQRVFGLYLSGNLSFEQARSQVQTLLDKAAADYASKNNVDFSKFR